MKLAIDILKREIAQRELAQKHNHLRKEEVELELNSLNKAVKELSNANSISTNKCDCIFCETYDKYKWAVVMECKCSCHNGNGMTGHGNLCCEFPNGLRKNNPYLDLMSAQYYKDIMEKYERDCEDA